MTPNSATTFPTPADRPQADVVLFDGQCNFCCRQMERLQWWDGGAQLAYLSIHDPTVAQRWPDLSHQRLLREMCVVEQPAGQDTSAPRYWGADAVRYLSRRLPRLRWLAPLLRVPGMMLLARPAYRLVARNRYLIGGKRVECDSDACALHR